METVALSRVSRDSMQDRVYEQIRDSIMAGRIKPGGSLTIRSIAQAVGTSPMPVREALRKLVAEGALIALPNRTLRVPPMSVERFNQLARIRMSLEGLAVEEAAGKILPADIDRLEKLDREMRRQRKPADYFILNRQFHFLVYEAAEMDELRAMIESLWMRVGPFFSMLSADKHCKCFPDKHADLIEALRSRDPIAARAMIGEDISVFAELMRERLLQQNSLGVA